jgi:RNA polymerase sigma-70 factor, ECF subfamily
MAEPWPEFHELHAMSADTPNERLRAAIDTYHAALYGYLRIMLGDRECAEDVLQETLTRAYRHLVGGKPLSAAWLYRVARNLAIDELRHRQRLRREADVAALATQEGPVPGYVWTVWETLAQLSAADRELLYLADVDNLSAAEIGAALGIRPGAVRTRLCRAHRRFRALYKDRS